MIKFKRTQGALECIELAFEPEQTVQQYVEDLADLYDVQPDEIKLVFKGKVLSWKSTAESAKLKEGTVMVVINSNKKQPKKVYSANLDSDIKIADRSWSWNEHRARKLFSIWCRRIRSC